MAKEQTNEKPLELTEGTKSQIQIIIWKTVAAIGIGIIALLGATGKFYLDYQTNKEKEELQVVKKEGNNILDEIRNEAKKNRRIIGLLTDFGADDYYVSNFKGRILAENPNANIIDISHNVGVFDVDEGAWILYNAARTLPEESILWGIVNPGADLRNNIFAVTQKPRHFLIGAKRSLFDHVISKHGLEVAYEPRISTNDDKFGTKSLARIVNALLSGGSIDDLISEGLIEKDKIEYTPSLLSCAEPIWKTNSVEGYVCSIDRWGNVQTNIPKTNFFSENGRYNITINGRTLENVIYGISYDSGRGRNGVIVEQDNWLQIAIYLKSAREYFNIDKAGIKIQIQKFK